MKILVGFAIGLFIVGCNSSEVSISSVGKKTSENEPIELNLKFLGVVKQGNCDSYIIYPAFGLEFKNSGNHNVQFAPFDRSNYIEVLKFKWYKRTDGSEVTYPKIEYSGSDFPRKYIRLLPKKSWSFFPSIAFDVIIGNNSLPVFADDKKKHWKSGKYYVQCYLYYEVRSPLKGENRNHFIVSKVIEVNLSSSDLSFH